MCGSAGTFHIQPLDNPAARVAFRDAHGEYRPGYQEVTFPKFERYVADAADLAKIVRHEKDPDFSYHHDLAVHARCCRPARCRSSKRGQCTLDLKSVKIVLSRFEPLSSN